MSVGISGWFTLIVPLSGTVSALMSDKQINARSLMVGHVIRRWSSLDMAGIIFLVVSTKDALLLCLALSGT